MLLTAACTQNNGHIGRLFGSWHLETATCNGQAYALPEGTESFWSFQAEIIMVTLEAERHESIKRYGTFEQLPDNILRIDFTHSSDGIPAGTGIYAAPQWMGFPDTGVFDLNVADTAGNRLVLSYTTPQSDIFTYTFSKTW